MTTHVVAGPDDRFYVADPNGVAVNPSSGRVFVAGRTGEALQLLDP
jgi:hypothetical protein